MRLQRSLLLGWVSVGVLLATGTGSAALTIKRGTAWPDRVIAVCWEAPRKQHAQERDLVRKAIAGTWQRESALRFVGWRGCAEGDRGIRIALETSYPRTRGRGTEIDGLERGVILPSLWALAALSVNLKAPVHEFGHALGFGHEHARPDAPDPERCSAKDGDGQRYTEPDAPLTPFDLDSIMVACISNATRDFSRGVPKLSASDIFGLVRTYGSNPSNVLDRDEPGDRFGAALLARDLDGDGVIDLAVGAPGEDEGAGAVYLYRGDSIGGLRPWTSFSAADLGAQGGGFGARLSWLPTGGGAALGRLLVQAGARRAFELVALSGEAPKPGGLSDRSPPADVSRPIPALDPSSLVRFGFPDLSGEAGRALQVVNDDLDGDGSLDTVVGAPHADGAARGSGAVIVLRGQASGPAAAWYWFGQAF